MASKLTVSVIIPLYNQASFLQKALDSLISQTDPNWEAIIVNDGSTDNCQEIIDNYTSIDSRIICFSQNNAGASSARNKGVELASGDLIMFLDADDWVAPITIEKIVDFMFEHPEYSMFNLKSVWIDEQTKQQKEGYSYKDYRFCLVYGQDNKVAIRKSSFTSSGGFDTSMRKGFEDWEFYVRLLNPDSLVKVSEDILYYYRINVSNNNVSSIGERNKQEVMAYIYKKNMDKYLSVLGAPQLQYQWADRRLPQFVLKIQHLRQKLIDTINRAKSKL